MQAVTYQYELQRDRTFVIQLSEDILPGRHLITVMTDENCPMRYRLLLQSIIT